MIDLGTSHCPPSSDPRWVTWSRPIAALVREPRPREDIARFCRAHRAPPVKAENLISFLENEGLLVCACGQAVLTPEGREWIGSYALSPADVVFAKPGEAAVRIGVIENLADRRFGKLVAKEMAPREPRKRIHWICQCDCGRTATVLAMRLKAERVDSCGRCASGSAGQAARAEGSVAA